MCRMRKRLDGALRRGPSSYEGKSPAELMNKMHEEGIVFQSEQQMGEFLRLLMDAFNNTRTKENRGNKPWELSERGMSGGCRRWCGKSQQHR